MNRIETIMSILEYTIDTQRKRHIVGGTLMSISLLFGGLAFTVITIKTKESKEKKDD